MALTTTAVVGMVIAAFVGRWLTQGMSGAEHRPSTQGSPEGLTLRISSAGHTVSILGTC